MQAGRATAGREEAKWRRLRRLGVIAAAAGWLCVGCDAPAPPPPAAPARPAAAAPTPPPAKKVEPVKVDANAFADVPAALDALTAAIKASDNAEVARVEAWFALRGGASVPTLADVIRDDSAELDRRLYACRAIVKTGPAGGEALLSLEKMEPELLYLRVIDSMGRIKPSSPALVARLKQVGFDGDVRTRQAGIAALARIGPAAKEVVPDLQQLLNDATADETLRKEAGKALKAIDPRKGLMGVAP
ncbi:MAG: hypothetical protein U0939_02870 [Pirellulales bacterium]